MTVLHKPVPSLRSVRRPFPKHTGTQPGATTRQRATDAPIESFTLQWGDLFAGDSTYQMTILFVYSDGTADWRHHVWARHHAAWRGRGEGGHASRQR